MLSSIGGISSLEDERSVVLRFKPTEGVRHLREVDPFRLSELMAVFMAWTGYVTLIFSLAFVPIDEPLRAVFDTQTDRPVVSEHMYDLESGDIDVEMLE
jgi:hypothetical protein